MRAFVQIFAAFAALDALLTLAEPWGSAGFLRLFVAALTLGFGALVYGAATFTRRVGGWPVAAVVYVAWARLGGAFPLGLLWPEDAAAFVAIGQIALAVCAFLAARRPEGPARAGFPWRRAVVLGPLALVGFPALGAGGLMTLAGQTIKESTGGYVQVRPRGVWLEEREFARAGQRVRLIGMTHIGQENFYRRVHESLAGGERTVVLLEGVTDRGGSMRGQFSYGKIAAMLGLSAQEGSALQQGVAPEKAAAAPASTAVDYRSADVDIESFSELTKACLREIGLVLSDPSLENVARVFGREDSPLQRADANAAVMHDILDRRNAHLLGEIRRALADYAVVVVPWGALHLPEIEGSLRAEGFQETRRELRPVVTW